MRIEKIVPHKTKSVFKQKGIKVAQIAMAMDLSFPYCCQILSGAVRCSKENDLKLKELAASLSKGGQ